MQATHDLLQPLLSSSHLPSLVAQLNRVVLEEEEKRREFYAWLDEDKRAEFLCGEIIIHSPARALHIIVLKKLAHLLDDFIESSVTGGLLLQEQAMVRLERSDVMPDLVFFNEETATSIKPDTKLFPVPDFIVEVLGPSTEKYDRGAKMKEYAANGVAEYWIVDPDKKLIEQYELHRGEYQRKATVRPGEMLHAVVLREFSFDPAAVFDF